MFHPKKRTYTDGKKDGIEMGTKWTADVLMMFYDRYEEAMRIGNAGAAGAYQNAITLIKESLKQL